MSRARAVRCWWLAVVAVDFWISASVHAPEGQSAQAFFEDDEGVYTTLKVARSPFERNFEHLGSPPTTFYLEVGANSDDDLLFNGVMDEPFSRGAFLISFEPLLDKYATLLARFTKKNAWSRLGLQHNRSLVLPFAVGCSGSASFHVARADGCSSLLEPRGHDFMRDPKSGGWAWYVPWTCIWEVERRQVPCISLEHVIGRWLRGHSVEYLKIDAQGYDLNVVQSAGRYVEQLQCVTLEVQCDSVAKLYVGAPNCTHVYAQMRRLGFVTSFRPDTCRWCMEADVHFARVGARLPPMLHRLVWEVGAEIHKP